MRGAATMHLWTVIDAELCRRQVLDTFDLSFSDFQQSGKQ
jgi:hypothetical protein